MKNQAQHKTYTNGKIAELTGLDPRIIQFYTKEGVIEPVAGGGKRGVVRLYSRESVIEFGIIKQLTSFGITLRKIRQIVEEFRTPGAAGFDRYRRRVINSKNGKRHNPYITFYFKGGPDESETDFHAVYDPGGGNKCIVLKTEDVDAYDGTIMAPGMDDCESCLVINLGKIIEKVGD